MKWNEETKNWKNFMGYVSKQWGKLSDDDLYIIEQEYSPQHFTITPQGDLASRNAFTPSRHSSNQKFSIQQTNTNK